VAVDELTIRRNVQTALEAISVANGYRTNVARVERFVRPIENVRVRPSVCWAVTDIDYTGHEGGDRLAALMRLSVIGHVRASSAEDREDKICHIADDIIGAMLADPGRGLDADGPNAIVTRVRGQRDTVTESEEADAFVVIDFEVEYMRPAGRSPA
jgi:hypothetical protein